MVCMSKWIDVTPEKWYYNEMVEASNIYLEDGEPLITGIPYNVFEDGSPYIYREIKATGGQTSFQLDVKVVPTNDNPLYVYIDGIQTVYKTVNNNGVNTTVELFQGVREGGTVSFASYGKPKINSFGRPTSTGNTIYPNYTLTKAGNYVRNTSNSQYYEYVYAFGKQLKRAAIPEVEWNSETNKQKVLRKYLRYETDIYYISPDGVIHLPYSLNGVSCKVVYATNEGFIKKNTEDFVPQSNSVVQVDRAFPRAWMTRAEGFVLLNRLRMTFYGRYTDHEAITNNLDREIYAYNGQRTVSVGGSYEVGAGTLEVWLNGEKQLLGDDYVESNEFTINFQEYLKDGDIVRVKNIKTRSTRLKDVGTHTSYTRIDTGNTVNINGTIGNPNPDDDSWWAYHILSLEQEILSNGDRMVEGMPVRADGDNVKVNGHLRPSPGDDIWFMPQSFMSRGEAIAIMNRFRKLCIEKLL